MPWLPRRGGHPGYLYEHSWRNSENWFQCAGGAQETLIQTLKLCVFGHYSIIPWFHDSNIPCGWHKTSIGKSCMISIYYRNSETYNYHLSHFSGRVLFFGGSAVLFCPIQCATKSQNVNTPDAVVCSLWIFLSFGIGYETDIAVFIGPSKFHVLTRLYYSSIIISIRDAAKIL